MPGPFPGTYFLDGSSNTQEKKDATKNKVTIVDSAEHQGTPMAELTPAIHPPTAPIQIRGRRGRVKGWGMEQFNKENLSSAGSESALLPEGRLK